MAALGLQSLTETQGTWLTVFVGVIAVCVLGITLGLVGALIAVMRLKVKVTKQVNEAIGRARPVIAEARSKVEPLIASATEMADDLKPKVKSISNDLAELSHMVRAQATDLDSTLSDVTSKARSQVARVNGMVSSTLDTTTEVVTNLERGIRAPFREISGILAGVKAGLDTLISPTSKRASARSTRYGHVIVPSHISEEVHRAAEESQADAVRRAQEGRMAASNTASSGSAVGTRSVVEAGEEA